MIAFGISYQPLLPTYPGEVLSTDQRSTGMGLMALILNLASESSQNMYPIEMIGLIL